MEAMEIEAHNENINDNEKERLVEGNLENESDLVDNFKNVSNKQKTQDNIDQRNDNLAQEQESTKENNVEPCDAVKSASKNIETEKVEREPNNYNASFESDSQSDNEQIKKKLKNRAVLSDSDSEQESEHKSKTNLKFSDDDSDSNEKLKNHTPRKQIVFSDSDSKSSSREITQKSENRAIVSNSESDESESKQIIKRKSRKHIAISDSDSESENVEINRSSTKTTTVSNSDSDSKGESEIKDIIRTKPRKRITAVSDSNSESENDGSNTKSNIKVKQTKVKSTKKQINRKNVALEDSDSENEITSHNKTSTDDAQENPIYITNSKGELVLEKSSPKANNWSALCDSESSDEGPIDNSATNEAGSDQMSEEEIVKPLPYKKKPKSKNEKEPKKMTGKEAAAQRQEIQSESQRMTRESSICLPYHRPKSFTLKEFLARRPKLASAVPLAAKTPPSVAIKMSVEQLEIISKKLEERHKEVKEFYKSDSEADDEDDDDKDDADYVPPPSEKTAKNVNQLESENPASEKEFQNETAQPENATDPSEIITENTDNTVKKDNLDTTASADSNKANVVVNDDNLDGAANTENDRGDEVMEVDNEIGIDTHDDFEDGSINKISENIEAEALKSDNQISRTMNNEFNKNENKETVKSNESEMCIEESSIAQNNLEDIEDCVTSNSKMNDKTEEGSDQRLCTDYDFNLDDVEEHSEQVNVESQKDMVDCEEDTSKSNFTEPGEESVDALETINSENIEESLDDRIQLDKDGPQEQQESSVRSPSEEFDFAELDREIENFGKETTSAEPEKPRLSKLELLKDKLANIQPRLSSSRDNIIDLDNVAKPTEVTKLMERFVKHTLIKPHHAKDKVKLNVVSVESGGEIHKETVAVHVDDDEDIAIEERPGVRLKKLRSELQTQIAQQRAQLWQNKSMKETKIDEDDTYKDEKSECAAADDALLDNDEEEEISESSEEEIDDDEEEIEDLVEEKPKKKSAFVDDEAEESDIEEEDEDIATGNDDDVADDADNSENEENDDEQVSDKENSDEVIEENDENKENEWKESDNVEKTPFKKPLRRIIKGFAEDSDEDDDMELTSTINKISEKLNRNNEESSPVTQDDDIPPYQIQHQNTPVRDSLRERSDTDLKFLTPVSYITGLQNLTNSASKLQSPVNVPSPLKEADWHTSLQKKLFADSVITESQAEAMAQLCSEKFADSQDALLNTQENSSKAVSAQENTGKSDEPSSSAPSSSQDLLNICSGDFHQIPSTQDLMNVCSGDFTDAEISTRDIPKNSVTHKLNAVEEVKSLGEDQDMLISQLLNEDEMEAFKKKFDSPVLPHTQRIVTEAEEVVASGGILDSDDEDDGVLEVKRKKKNQKKLTFSDDESSEEEDEQEEEIDLHDEVDEEEEDFPADVNYDSEENEVEYTNEKENENVKLRDFFEDEAELSESEWGSADEDEKDLDAFEAEQGDAEKFDEKQMRTDLERIHMRRMLDDDTREVKMLQEMLLDDGELHGTGRERQFRWKNIDSLEMGDEPKRNSDDDDDVRLDEEESEEQWRRKRHEREMFLKEKQSQEVLDDEDDLLSGSEILKIGHKFLQRTLSNSQGSSSVEKSKTMILSSPSLKSSFNFVNKRGSFLSRGDQMLQKIAEYSKTTITTEVVAQKAKNSKNFLFQTKEVQEATAKLSIFNNKRKSIDGTPKAIKKLRLTENLSPAVKRKKKPDKLEARTKLFKVS